MLRILTLNVAALLVLSVSELSIANQQPFPVVALLDGVKIENTGETDKVGSKVLPASAFKTIEWIDLMPKDDLEAILNPPDYIAEIEDGSIEDQIDSEIGTSITTPEDRYQQALVSKRVVDEMDGKAIRIPGFIVPLEFNDKQDVTQFFLVPFFGACIHLPPPPPNQIIFVEYPEGLELNSPYTPFWISGIVKTSLTENDVAISAYSIKTQYVEVYTE